MAPARSTPAEDVATERPDSTTARVVAVLDALARSPEDGIGVRQLALDLALSRSAVHRILQNLAELGVARSLRGGGYEAGPVLASWGAFLAGRHSLHSAAGDVMERLVAQAEETSYLFLFNPVKDDLTLTVSRECDKPVRYVLEIGTTAPLHLGAAGKAMLAQLPSEHVDALELDMPPRKASAFRKALKADIEATRARGYAVSFGERIPEAVGIAAGFTIDGTAAGVLTISTPSFRMDRGNTERFGELVSAAAHELSGLLEAPIAPVA